MMHIGSDLGSGGSGAGDAARQGAGRGLDGPESDSEVVDHGARSLCLIEGASRLRMAENSSR